MADSSTVLIVDDDVDCRSIAKFTLERAGFKVFEAENGLSALHQIERERPELMVLDIVMPGLDGWGVLEELQRRSLRFPVIACTALALRGDRERLLAKGCVTYLAKPYRPTELARLVRERLEALDS